MSDAWYGMTPIGRERYWQAGLGFFQHNPPPMPATAEYLPVHDPNEPANSPYFVPPPMPAEAVAAELPAEPEPQISALDAAVAWLRDVLAIDPVPATEVARLAKDASIAARTLRRAFQKWVQTFKRAGAWWWQLPTEDGPAKGGRIRRRPRPRKNSTPSGTEA
jgi:hypothetical protein